MSKGWESNFEVHEMACLRWSNSNWHVYSTAGTGAFLWSVYQAGLTPMPPEVSRRVRVYRRLIDRSMVRSTGRSARLARIREAKHATGAPDTDDPDIKQLLEFAGWRKYVWRADIDYPPPQVSRPIMELESERAIRVITGEEVLLEQDQHERALIRRARGWPLEEGDDGC